MKAYIVCGESGEYSDWTTWMVEGFFEEAAAIAKMNELNKNALPEELKEREEGYREYANMFFGKMPIYWYVEWEKYQAKSPEEYIEKMMEQDRKHVKQANKYYTIKEIEIN